MGQKFLTAPNLSQGSTKMSTNPQLDEDVRRWLAWDRNPTTRSEIQDLVDASKWDQLSALLTGRMSFGTAGLRGRMGAGNVCMNDLVIVQTAQGFLRYLEEQHGELLKTKGIVIGYDGRHNSRRFAQLTATIFVRKNYPVRLFGDMTPTPFVPFAVARYGCAAGIMVTASHNPKEDNGYKVYGWNSAQIISPVDKHIQKKILENLEPWEGSWDIIDSNRNLKDPLVDVFNSYVQAVSFSILEEDQIINFQSQLKLTYTAMHGVGYKYVKRLLKTISLDVIAVEEQKDPHPDFPTVKFPNPEEGKSSLDLSIKTANANDSTIILANDPDADRLAVAEKTPDGEWRVFNGNELGGLLGWWILHRYKTQHGFNPDENCYVLSSTVSSKILKSISKAEGINFIETLTGFKWMGNEAYDLIQDGKKVLFAFEEAIGFMCGSIVLDKDGVSAAAHVATMASYLASKKVTLVEQLDKIYEQYGHHVSDNSYFLCYDQKLIETIFERLRNFESLENYPKGILDGKYEICNVRDLTTGYDNNQPDNKAILPVSKSSQMITFCFTNGLVATLRTSGTEPKIKYYTELCAAPSERDESAVKRTLHEMVTALVSEFLEPDKNGLIAKSD